MSSTEELQQLEGIDDNESSIRYGDAESTFQRFPINPDHLAHPENLDIWEEYLVNVGINPKLRKSLDKSNTTLIEVFEVFTNQIVKIAHQYDKHGIKDRNHRLFYLEVDLDVLEIAFSDSPKAKVLKEGLRQVMFELKLKNLQPIFCVNQAAGFRNLEDQVLRKERCEKFITDNFRNAKLKFLNEFDKNSYVDSVEEFLEYNGGRSNRAFRISAEMSRILKNSSEGKEFNWDYDVLINLADSIKLARENDVDFTLCLHHFTLPKWIEGGWENPQIAEIYSKFSRELLLKLNELNALPDRVLTLNEPMAFVPAGYIDGSWPPYKKADHLAVFAAKVLGYSDISKKLFPNVKVFKQAFDNTIETHFQMYRSIKDIFPKLPVGFTFNAPVYSPFSNLPVIKTVDKFVADTIQSINESWLEALLDRTKKEGRSSFDFIGLQFYNRYYAGISGRNVAANPGEIKNEIPDWMKPMMNGWGYYPEGLIINILKTTMQFIELSKYINGVVPGIEITEVGKPAIYNPIPYHNKLRGLIKFINNFNPIKINFMHFWTGKDNLEWSANLSNSRFGINDLNGNPKPESSINLPEIDWNDPLVQKVVVGYLEYLRHYDYSQYVKARKEIESMISKEL